MIAYGGFFEMKALCALLFLVGTWLVFLNWRCFYVAFIKKKPSPSWIPLLGGILMFLGFYLFPDNLLSSLAWLAFVLDWGSLPGIGHAIVHHRINKKK